MRWAVEVAGRQRRERHARSRARPQALKPGYVVWVSREIRTRRQVPRLDTCPTARTRRGSARTSKHEWDDDAPRRRAARAGAAPADDDLHRRSPHRLRRRDGRRLRLRPLGVQPRRAGVPPAGLDVQADLLLARPRPGLRLRHDPQRHPDRRSSIPTPARSGRRRTSTTRMDGDVTLEYALVFSKNIPSVDLFKRLGAKNVEAWARRLGFSTKIFADDALALGASCSKLDEMARAFTVFARNGTWWPRPAGKEKNWVYVRRILDRDGNTDRGQHGRRGSAARRRRPLRSPRGTRRASPRRRRSRRARRT